MLTPWLYHYWWKLPSLTVNLTQRTYLHTNKYHFLPDVASFPTEIVILRAIRPCCVSLRGSSRTARVVHSDWPEIKAMKKYVSVVEKIGLNVLNAKSLETQRRIRGGILWVEIIPLMDLTQFGLKEQYSLAQDWHGLRNSHGGLRSCRMGSQFEPKAIHYLNVLKGGSTKGFLLVLGWAR